MVDSKGWVVVECIVHYCGVVCLFVVSFLINRLKIIKNGVKCQWKRTESARLLLERTRV